MTPLLPQLSQRLSHLLPRAGALVAKRNWTMGGARANPDLRGVESAENFLGQLQAALRRYRIRRRWQRDLQMLDDRQLRDIGVSRDDAERVIRQIRFWI